MTRYLHHHFSYFLYIFLFLFLHSFPTEASFAEQTLYLSWQRDPTTTMTIQWLTSSEDKQSIINYRPKSNNTNEWLQTKGTEILFPQSPQYSIHRVELENLKPNTEYIFTIPKSSNQYQFLTAPSKLDKKLHFVVGGDMYHDGIEIMAKTNRIAAKTAPLFAVIGGDIAYAVKSIYFPIQENERWIEWIKVWHSTMISPSGNLIPVIAAIGNHDVIGQYDQTPAHAAVFSALFPMPGKRIYNVLDFDDYLSIILLDSGHANSVTGVQAKWLECILKERKDILHRFPVYHVPAFPSIRRYKSRRSAIIRKAWVPIFEKEGIKIVFEHHDHAYKRTFPLLKGKINPNGITYIGDGGWGVEEPRECNDKRFYLSKFASIRNFIKVSIDSESESIDCINDDGQIMDRFEFLFKKR